MELDYIHDQNKFKDISNKQSDFWGQEVRAMSNVPVRVSVR